MASCFENMDGKNLSTESAGGFVGAIIGMYATPTIGFHNTHICGIYLYVEQANRKGGLRCVFYTILFFST